MIFTGVLLDEYFNTYTLNLKKKVQSYNKWNIYLESYHNEYVL